MNLSAPIPPVDLKLLIRVFSNLDLKGVRYGLGSKIPLSWDSHDARIKRVDCSGWVRFGLYKATEGKLTIPDGSWNQKAFFDALVAKGASRKVNYMDLPKADNSRLFIAFITPHVNGAGGIGHVWFVVKLDDDSTPDTMESHGGRGINSRRWNTLVLRSQVSSCYEIPTLANA